MKLNIGKVIASLIILMAILIAASTKLRAQSLTCWTLWNKPTQAEVYKFKNIETINIACYASFINPVPGRYNWDVVETELANCKRYNKKAILSIVLNSKVAEWVKDSCYPNVAYFTDLRHQGDGKRYDVTIPLPWDSTYQEYCLGFIKEMKRFVGSNAAYDSLIIGISYGALGTTTLELKLPDVGDNPDITNAPEEWKKYGYTSRKVLSSFNIFRRAYIEAFSTKLIVFDMMTTNQFPIICDTATNGGINCDTVNINERILRICMESGNPSRYVFKHTSLAADGNGKMVNYINSLGLKTCAQTSQIKYGVPCDRLCDETGFRQALRVGKGQSLQWIEVQVQAILNFPSSVVSYKFD